MGFVIVNKKKKTPINDRLLQKTVPKTSVTLFQRVQGIKSCFLFCELKDTRRLVWEIFNKLMRDISKWI